MFSTTYLEEVFHSFDKDGDGKISAADLTQQMKTIGMDLSAEEIGILQEFDDDGLLAFEELAKLAEFDGESGEDKALREAFEMFAMEGEGCITAESLKRMLDRLGMSRDVEECKGMVCRFDLDGDGVISFEEFKVMMM